MARDYVTVANLATGFVGDDDQIRSIDDDTKPARTVRVAWDEVRKFVLSQGAWDFATVRRSLAARPITDERPVFTYQNAYPLPQDFRRLIEVLEPCDIVENYAIESGEKGLELLADTDQAVIIRYVRDVEEVALWNDGFTQAFVMRLAWQIADRLTGDKVRKEQAGKAFIAAMRDARATDAKQNPPRPFVEGDWVRARQGGVTRAPNT